jgi:hypothetical protein
MNQPPSSIVFESIKNIDIDAVSFYRYEANIMFDNRNRLSFSAPFRFNDAQHISDSPILDFPLSESELIRILGHHVCEVKCDTDGTLELLFSNCDILIIYANDPAYESYSLFIDGKEYVI